MTATQELATIERVDIREVWSNEASDFTPWLAEHLSELGEALGLDLELQSVEAPVGGYSLDILARDERDRQVIIENQLEATDHSHLGQLLTYAAGYDANVVVWIAREFRDEHREALDLLNRRTDEETEFFGTVVEVWKIDGSRPAPHFRVVSAPNDWRKQNASSRPPSNVSERDERYRTFWHSFIGRLRDEHRFTNRKSENPRNWCSFSAGYKGFGYTAAFATRGGKRARVEVYIDNGDKNWNEQRFDQLADSREEIESEIGGALEWERLDKRRACRISTVRQGSIDDDTEMLEEIRGWMTEKLLSFKQVFGPRLSELVE